MSNSLMSLKSLFLMVKHKLARIHDRPEDIFQSLLLVRVRRHQVFQLGALGRQRFAAQTANVELIDDLSRRFLLDQTPTDKITRLDFLRRGVAIEKVQRLG